ncbi:hypothetical protein [Shewanella sp. KJ2020]|uniref:hypothetical protein n=1 Tax=Shewanella sp. KJ2020 TaxID=2919172 RepID=UPI0020A6EE39|nr:hypothetical protein [Shewanella sp. KJ2020]MCP3127269.1 hypothetical protein [Shewanella sp. KJ2020]
MTAPTVSPLLLLSGDPFHLLGQLSTFHSLKLICRLKQILPAHVGRTVSSHAGIPMIAADFELRIIAEAYNCFENFDVEIYLTFQRDRDAWMHYQQEANEMIKLGHSVLVTAEVYSHIDGSICVYDPQLTPTDMPFIQ